MARTKGKYYAKPWITVETRIGAVKDYLAGTSPQRVANNLGVHYTTIYGWAQKYYKKARNGITITPRLRNKYGVKVTKSGVEETHTNGRVTPVDPEQFIQSMEQAELVLPPVEDKAAELTDIKIAGNFELVDGKAYATEIVVSLGTRTNFKLTKDTLKLLNDLGSKLL